MLVLIVLKNEKKSFSHEFNFVNLLPVDFSRGFNFANLQEIRENCENLSHKQFLSLKYLGGCYITWDLGVENINANYK